MYVSHRLPEVLGIADRITVLRDGVNQGTFEAAEMSEDRLVALMIGRPLQLAFPDRDSDRASERRSASRWPGSKVSASGRSTLTVHRGEVLGLAGAEGNGQGQFLRALAGASSFDRDGEVQRHRPRRPIAGRPATGGSRAT